MLEWPQVIVFAILLGAIVKQIDDNNGCSEQRIAESFEENLFTNIVSIDLK